MIGKILRFFTPIVILTASVAIGFALMRTGPVPKKAPSFSSAPAVEVIRVEPTSFTPIVEGSGVVIPAKRLAVHAEVSGRLIEVHESVVPGGIVEEDDTLFRINDDEYVLLLAEQEASVAKAELDLTIEEGRHSVASREWDRIEGDLEVTSEGRSLALRMPQLDHARRHLRAIQSRVDRAQLNVDRTEIGAPFNAIVQSESVEMDLLVTPQTPLVTLVGTDTFWVQASLPVERLAWIRFPDGDEGSTTRVLQRADPNYTVIRHARLLRLLSDVESRGRMARVLIAVDDPLLLQGESTLIEEPPPELDAEVTEDSEEPTQNDLEDLSEETEENDETEAPPDEAEEVAPRIETPRFKKLLLGSYVSVSIESDPLEGVYRLDRNTLRQGDNVWIAKEDETLEIRKVHVVWRTEDEVIIDGGLRETDRVIVSKLPTPIAGMSLDVIGEEPKTPDVTPDEEASEEEATPDEEASEEEAIPDEEASEEEAEGLVPDEESR